MEPRTTIYKSLMQIMLWVMFAVFSNSIITFFTIKTHAGTESFVSAKGSWSLAHTSAKNAYDNYLANQFEADFESYKTHIKTCLEIRDSLMAFEQGNYQKGKTHLIQSQVHNSAAAPMAFLYKYFSSVSQVDDLLNNWNLANQKVYDFNAAAILTHQAINNNAPPSIIKAQKAKAEILYSKITPLETHLANKVHSITVWAGQLSFKLTAIIYTLMGLMLYFGIRRTLNAFHERDALYHATFHHSSVGIIQLDLKGKIQRMNQAFCDIFSVTSKEMKGRRVMTILEQHQNQPPNDQAVFKELSPEKPTFSYLYKITNRKGQLVWMKSTITKIFNQQNIPVYYLAIIEDITDLHMTNEKLKQMAHHDYLTGLSNKFSLDKKLSDALNSDLYGVLFCMELDNFKKINDTAGHAAGDQALIEVAHILRLSFKKEDFIARIGGDEFAAFVIGLDMEVAQSIKAGITQAIDQHLISYERQTFQLGISIGLAALNNETLSSKQLMLQADTAAYEAKSNKQK